MSELDLDLDAILAEFHAQEKQPTEEPVPATRRQRAEDAEESLPAAPLEGATTRYVARTERQDTARGEEPARAQTPVRREPAQTPAQRNTAPLPESGAPRTEKPKQRLAPSPEKLAEREARAAKRRTRGRIRMAIVLVVLTAILAGLLWWTIREEEKNAIQEPEPLNLNLGGELEDYLDYAATHSNG